MHRSLSQGLLELHMESIVSRKPRWLSLVAALMSLGQLLAPSSCQAQAKFEGRITLQIPQRQLREGSFSPDGRVLVTGGDAIRVYAWENKQLLQTIRPTLRPRPIEAVSVPVKLMEDYLEYIGGWPEYTTQVGFLPGSQSSFVTVDGDGAARIWRLGEDSPRLTLMGLGGSVKGLCFSSDGGSVFCLSALYNRRGQVVGGLQAWTLPEGRPSSQQLFYHEYVGCIGFSPDGRYFALSRYAQLHGDSVIEVRRCSDMEVEHTVTLKDGHASSILFLAEGDRILATGGECLPNGNGCLPQGRIWLFEHPCDQAVEPIRGLAGGHYSFANLLGSGKQFLVRTYVHNGGRRIDRLEVRACETGAVARAIDIEMEPFQGLAVHPFSSEVVVLGPQSLQVINHEASQCIVVPVEL